MSQYLASSRPPHLLELAKESDCSSARDALSKTLVELADAEKFVVMIVVVLLVLDVPVTLLDV
jgi:hypothetical protein